MKISLVMSLYNEYYLVENTLDSILGNTKHEVDVHINLSGPRFVEKNVEYLQKIESKDKNYRLQVHSFGGEIYNIPMIGNATLIQKSHYEWDYDIVVVGSPDYIISNENGFDEFIDKAQDHLEDKYTISCIEHAGSNLRSAFQIITKKRIEEVGYLDPNFVPMGSSDVDMHRRCLLVYNPGQSLEYYNSPESDIHAPYGVNIVIPSRHLSYTEYGTLGVDYTSFLYKSSFDYLNQKYYWEKWGGTPTSTPGNAATDKYIHPFNDPTIPLKISYKQLMRGYSKHDRTDLKCGGII